MTRTHIIATLLASAIIALAASVAGANELLGSGTQFDIKWDLEGLGFIPSFGEAVTCDMTVLGRFHLRPIAKVEHALIGIIDHVRIGANAPDHTETCEGGAATALTADLPWHVTYEGFGASLPNITEVAVLLLNAAFRIQNEIAACLAEADFEDPARGIVSLDPGTGQAVGFDADGSSIIDLSGLFCNSVSGAFAGTGLVENRRGGLFFIDLI